MRSARRYTACRLAYGLLSGMLTVLNVPVRAQDAFPAQTIRIIVPFTPGGTADVLARAIGARLQTQYRSSVVVENRPGAGGHIGAEAAAKARPDGYTLVLGTIGIHAAYTIYRNLGYDPARDLRPVILLGEVPCALVVHPSRPFDNLDQFLAYARENPAMLNFGSAGNGSATHMIAELFQQAAGVKLRHVPYRGSSTAMNDLIAGQIDLMFELVTTAAPVSNAGAIRALAVTSAQRRPVLPDVPAINERAIPGFEATGWFTVATAAGVPEAVVARLNRDIDDILRAPGLQGMWNTLALTVIGGAAERATTFFESEREKWGKVIKAANIRID
jgi:tripartite-type tricarboxylate transporter receptor subunit TctC